MVNSLKYKMLLLSALITLSPNSVWAGAGATDANTFVFSNALSALCGIDVKTLTDGGNENAIAECYEKLNNMTHSADEGEQELAQKVLMDDKMQTALEFIKEGNRKKRDAGYHEEEVISEKVDKKPPTTQIADGDNRDELLKSISKSVNSLIATATARMSMDLLKSYNDVIERNLGAVVEVETETGAKDLQAPSEQEG